MFRASFTLDAEPVSGSVKVVGLGHYELLLNGTRPGQALINQPWSEYNKTIYYQEFDISKLLKKGENVWGVMLGNSFWRVEKPTDTMRYVKTDAMPDFSEGRPYLIWLEAHVKMSDGREKVISSDGSWKWHDGPLTSSNIYGGEDFDARLNPAGWNLPGFDDRSWLPAKVVPAPKGSILPFTAPPITAHEVFEPVKIVSPHPGEYTYIFSQNCSALLRFTVEGEDGEESPVQTLRIRGFDGSCEIHLYMGNRQRDMARLHDRGFGQGISPDPLLLRGLPVCRGHRRCAGWLSESFKAPGDTIA
jgi:alpha-L-rhamnosidase